MVSEISDRKAIVDIRDFPLKVGVKSAVFVSIQLLKGVQELPGRVEHCATVVNSEREYLPSIYGMTQTVGRMFVDKYVSKAHKAEVRKSWSTHFRPNRFPYTIYWKILISILGISGYVI